MIRSGLLAHVSALALLASALVSGTAFASGGAGTEPPAAEIILDIPSLPELGDITARDLAAQADLGPAAVEPKEPASIAGAPTAIALIERETSSEPLMRIDIPLPDDFVSFEGMERGTGIQPPLVTAQPDEPAQPEASKRETAEAPFRLDIPEQPEIVVSIDVPAAGPVMAAEATSSRLQLAELDEARIRLVIEPLRQRLKLRAGTTEGFVAAYSTRDGRAFWFDGNGQLLPAAGELVATLKQAEIDALNPERLLGTLPVLDGSLTGDARIEAELRLSMAAWLYAHDARGGRIIPQTLSKLLTPTLTIPAPAEVLAAIEDRAGKGLQDALAAYQPQHPGYRALRLELAKIRARIADPVVTSSVNGGGSNAPAPAAVVTSAFMGDAPLAVGQSDQRVPLIRARLRLPAADDNLYAGAVVEAVKAFQRANGLTPNGRITPRTRAMLDDPRLPITESEKQPDLDSIADTIIANMERWRWLPTELGATHIFVNIPEFRLEMMAEGDKVFETRVIVGKTETQTPVFSDTMEYLVVNPSWTVPPSIMKKEFLPRLAADPEYAARRGFEVIRRGNSVSVRQPPGERNALGHIKFMFPNDHAVYLHDTPTRHLFGTQTRAYSHGCVRVEGPFRLAEHILQKSQGLTEKSLRAMLGRSERTIRLTERIPVHLAYFTVFVDKNGVLQSRNDLYGHDARIRRALAL